MIKNSYSVNLKVLTKIKMLTKRRKKKLIKFIQSTQIYIYNVNIFLSSDKSQGVYTMCPHLFFRKIKMFYKLKNYMEL